MQELVIAGGVVVGVLGGLKGIVMIVMALRGTQPKDRVGIILAMRGSSDDHEDGQSRARRSDEPVDRDTVA